MDKQVYLNKVNAFLGPYIKDKKDPTYSTFSSVQKTFSNSVIIGVKNNKLVWGVKNKAKICCCLMTEWCHK